MVACLPVCQLAVIFFDALLSRMVASLSRLVLQWLMAGRVAVCMCVGDKQFENHVVLAVFQCNIKALGLWNTVKHPLNFYDICILHS